MAHRSVVAWTALISEYSRSGYAEKALELFILMHRSNVKANDFTYGSVLRASSSLSRIETGEQVHGRILRSGFCVSVFIQSALIDLYSKFQRITNARFLFERMPARDVACWNVMISGFAVHGREVEAFEILRKMIHGIQIHALAVKKTKYDRAMGNALIDMYAKSGEVVNAHRAFDEMDKKNVISWTSLITGYGIHGYGKEALALFDMMKENGLKPNDVTFLSVLFACSHSGLVREGWECFCAMITEYKINAKAEHYSCIVDLFARGGWVEEAYALVRKINIKPEPSVWGAMLRACNICSNKYIGEIAARHLFTLDRRNSVNYVVLSSIYASAGLWSDASDIRALMEKRGLNKDSGLSFISSIKVDTSSF